MTTKHKHRATYKHYCIGNILKTSEKTLNAIWQFMEKYNLPECEVKLKCQRK